MDRLNLMETFVCVVDAGSFSGAARQLNVGQPAVSKAIAELEERLSVRLVLRSTRGLTTTEAGQNYYEGARRTLAEAEQADAAARGAGASLKGRLRIAAAVSFARLHIVRHLQKFLDDNPDLEIDLLLDDSNIDLLEKGVDVALRIGKLPDSGMTAKKVAIGRTCVLASADYFATSSPPKVPADLLNHAIVLYSPNLENRAFNFRKGTSEVSLNLAGKIRCSAAEGVRSLVMANLGIAVASEWMFAPELANGTAVSVLNDWELPQLELWAVYPSGRMVSAKARAFTAFIEEIMQNNDNMVRKGKAAAATHSI